jgi:glutaredoxin-related protein
MNFQGKIPRNHNNMRTEFAWMVALDAYHYNIQSTPVTQYDLGIVIIPKKNPNFDINNLKQYCKKVAVMQEGPNWYWQDYPLTQQIWYFNTLTSSDIIFTHNQSDRKYYQGLTSHNDVRVMQSLMIEEAIGNIETPERNGVIIGGNFVSWYGGFDSFMIAQELEDKIWAPSMGRKQDGEDQLLNHLPYLNWTDWIHSLNNFKYGVHLMRTHAAGTFALNCAYLGIPCIGYKGLDTQEILHTDLSVDVGDLKEAKKIAKNLRNDKDFYVYYSNKCKDLYQNYYTEQKFKEQFYEHPII